MSEKWVVCEIIYIMKNIRIDAIHSMSTHPHSYITFGNMLWRVDITDDEYKFFDLQGERLIINRISDGQVIHIKYSTLAGYTNDAVVSRRAVDTNGMKCELEKIYYRLRVK